MAVNVPSTSKDHDVVIPEIIIDNTNHKKYRRCNFLGKVIILLFIKLFNVCITNDYCILSLFVVFLIYLYTYKACIGSKSSSVNCFYCGLI